MERFTLLEGDHTLKDSRAYLNDALLTVRSLSAGDAFPTDNLSDGMLCYRTDLARLYQLADSAQHIWTDKLAADISGQAATALTADAAPWQGITDKPAVYPPADHSHPYAGASTAGGAAQSADKLATARTINGIPFDGTANITIDTGVKTVNSAVPDEAGNVTISAMPVAAVIACAADTDPDGYLFCGGASVSRTTYADLFAAIGTTYGEGDGTSTFTLPDLTDRFIMGSTAAGTAHEAGLPNITGSFATEAYLSGGHTPDGAFSAGESCKGAPGGGTDHIITFDASLSDPIYGASTTVQPPALTMRYYIKY